MSNQSNRIDYIEKEWYAPFEIIPTVFQLREFLLPNLNDLRGGTYPTDPQQSGRPGYNPVFRPNARFVSPVEVAAEVDKRLDRLPVYSAALELWYADNWQYNSTIDELARKFHCGGEWLLAEMKWMLRYMAGKRIKIDSYIDWKTKALYDRKIRYKNIGNSLTGKNGADTAHQLRKQIVERNVKEIKER